MIKTEIDLTKFSELENKILTLEQTDTVLRTVATAMFAEMKRRIHNDGIKSNGSSIGTYSNSYLKWRLKNGFETQGNKVQLNLTGQMQNDFSVGKLNDTSWAIGFQNEFNYKKSVNAEEGRPATTVKAHKKTIKGKSVDVKSYVSKGWKGYGKIYDLTENETKQVRLILADFMSKFFK